ncbi:hypothetical protein J2858_003106 [Neorhizobium galegae]|nr:hypothetical protein [Neorhizobium galegae]
MDGTSARAPRQQSLDARLIPAFRQISATEDNVSFWREAEDGLRPFADIGRYP